VVTVVDLGLQPLSNAYLLPSEVSAEQVYPLHARYCERCHLVQVDDVVPPEMIFSDYAYFSSYADSWVEHARRYTEMAIERFELGAASFVVEVASNDGYLLRHFIDRGVPVLGIEPAANVAEVARAAGVPTEVAFFGTATAAEVVDAHGPADLVVANNVLAHVPDLNDFVGGLEVLLAPGGVVTVEVPHLLRLVEQTQFDTIYHEHYSYFSLLAMQYVFERHGLTVFDVDRLDTHGGSLRVYGCHRGDARHPVGASVTEVLELEREAHLDQVDGFRGFAQRAKACCDGLAAFLADQREAGAVVVGYGAAAKGNTLLNAIGADKSTLAYVVDRNPHKQGRLLPGSHLEIHSVDRLSSDRPPYVLILPWNLREEIVGQMAQVRDWGGRFVIAVPELEVF
jgi:SAM-dependent methyltransferase